MIIEDYSEVDREGFSIEAYKYVKKSNELSVITNLANASLYSIRNMCSIFTIAESKLANINPEVSLDDDQPPF